MASQCGGNADKGKMSGDQRKKIADSKKGKSLSADTKKKISEGLKNSTCKKKKT